MTSRKKNTLIWQCKYSTSSEYLAAKIGTLQYLVEFQFVNHPLSAGLIDENKIVQIVLDFPLKYIQDSLSSPMHFLQVFEI
jgi:hypothetical protein